MILFQSFIRLALYSNIIVWIISINFNRCLVIRENNLDTRFVSKTLEINSDEDVGNKSTIEDVQSSFRTRSLVLGSTIFNDSDESLENLVAIKLDDRRKFFLLCM